MENTIQVDLILCKAYYATIIAKMSKCRSCWCCEVSKGKKTSSSHNKQQIAR